MAKVQSSKQGSSLLQMLKTPRIGQTYRELSGKSVPSSVVGRSLAQKTSSENSNILREVVKRSA